MESIRSATILIPVVVMVFLVIAVFFATMASRVSQMNKERIHPQQLQTRAEMAARINDSRASDHLANMFEAPILFYIACIVIYTVGIMDTLYVSLAWLFVALRFVQAAVHLSFNHVLTRATVFGLGVVTLAVMWVRIAFELFALG